jgi:ribosome maturation factor RimP
MKRRKAALRKELMAIINETITEQFPRQGLELIDIELKGEISNRLVQVYLDKDGGITLDDCAEFSKRLSTVLDVKNPIKEHYTLEVSSPGGRRKHAS